MIYVYSRDGGFYQCSKQSAEHYVEEYQRRYGLDYTILRYGSLYGPRSDHRNGLWRIVKSALDAGGVSYQGSSEEIRDYIHVEDAGQPDDFLKEVSSLIPMGRLAKTNEYQGALLFLLSDSSAYLNGAILPMDGGRVVW
jgi:hypothetical protein